MNDCVFCNIANKILDKDLLYEDEDILAFLDILPKAPVHIQIITREHIPSVAHLEPRHQPLVGKMVLVAKQLGERYNISDTGYKLVFNVGRDGGQVIPHLHLHLMGGKKMPE